MPTGVYKHKPCSEETKRKMRGKIPWNKGKKCTQFSGENNPMYGKHHSMETRIKLRQSHLGKNLGEKNPAKRKEVREKIRQTLLGHSVSEKTREKISELSKGKHFSPNTEFKKGYPKPKNAFKFEPGEKHFNWQNGKSFEPYSVDWVETLKRSIRERDRYACRLCGKLQEDEVLSVHHIDYNKKNCNPDNLITLCRNCHTKTNFNRKYWGGCFKNEKL